MTFSKIMKKDLLIKDSCFNSSKYIEDDSVDMFFCDPPYNILKGQSWDSQWKTNQEFYDWTESWIQLMFKQLKVGGTAYVCISWQHSHMFHLILEKVGFIINNRITWKRDKGRGSKKNWKSIHEDIFFVSKGKEYQFNIEDVMVEKKVIAPYRDDEGNPKGWWENENGEKVRLTYPSNLWEDFSVPFWSSKEVRSYAKTKRTPENDLQKHPTQKPKDLVKRCILASTNEGDLVVDYFLGSGTTLISSIETNREFVGFEICEEYQKIIEKRIQNEIKNENKLFDFF